MDNENEIIKRLLETNEKARQEADKKFRIVAFLLLLSMLGNVYLALKDTVVVLESADNKESTITQTQG